MKIRIVFLVCFISAFTNAVFANNLPQLPSQQENNGNEFRPVFNNWSANRKISIIPYGQLSFIFPGYGLTMRVEKESFGIQADANMTHADLGYFGSWTYLQAAVSGVYYPFASNDTSFQSRGLNMTFGMGVYHEFDDETNLLWGPLSIGYLGEKIFFDAGISATELLLIGHDRFNNGKSFIFSVPFWIGPSIKIGVRF